MRKNISIGIVLAAVFTLSFFYCNGNGPTEPETPETVKEDPSFSQDIQPIFTSSCALSNCHNATAQAGLVLLQGQAYNNIVNVNSTQDPSKKRVEPGKADNSYLVIKIEGRQTVGGRMPLGGAALSSARIQNIKNWINRGAKNN
jgi:hypothetical protein